MQETIEKLSQSKSFVIIALIFSFGGIVNLGQSGVAFAIPFLVVLGKTALTKGNPFAKFALPFFVLAFPLYVLKHIQTPVYYPALGKTLKSTQDLCLKEKTFLVPQEGTECLIVPAGTAFTIKKFEIEEAIFNAKYVAQLETAVGTVPLDDFSKFVWEDGTQIKVKHLRNNFFYAASWLMTYPNPVIFLFKAPIEVVTSFWSLESSNT